MRDDNWEYYGRDGVEGYSELWRTPKGIADPNARFAAMQRFHKDGIWRDASNDPALCNDWLTGWFDFDDNRITPNEAETLIKDWSQRSEWPGRP